MDVGFGEIDFSAMERDNAGKLRAVLPATGPQGWTDR
jgi:hypothetical protein